MSEEKQSDDKNKLDRPLGQEVARPESRMDETSLIKSSGSAPISSMDQVARGYYNSSPDETRGIRENWRKIRKRKWLVLSVTVIVTTVVIIESFRTKTSYQATATVALSNDNPAVVK